VSDEEAEKATNQQARTVLSYPEAVAFNDGWKRGESYGRKARDAEVAELERQIQGWVRSATEAKDAHRAEVEALRTRLAEAEAVIESAREVASRYSWSGLRYALENVNDGPLSASRATVLAAHDREVAKGDQQ
jgi:hypothetical protein